MTIKYKSIEQRVFVDSGMSDFVKYAGKTLYGFVIGSMLRIPTTIRKGKNEQVFTQIEDINDLPNKYCGAFSGIIMGLIADALIFTYSVEQTFEQNYIPLAILGSTNLASGFYEFKRLEKSKQENLELKAQKGS